MTNENYISAHTYQAGIVTEFPLMASMFYPFFRSHCTLPIILEMGKKQLIAAFFFETQEMVFNFRGQTEEGRGEKWIIVRLGL